MLFALLAVGLFSVSAVTATRAARSLGGTEANFWRLCVATSLLAVYAHGWGPGLSGPVFHTFIASGLLGFGLGDQALFQALPRLGSRLAIMLVHCVAAPFAGLVEWLWMGVAPGPWEIASAALIIAGVVVALSSRKEAQSRGDGFGIGIGFGVLAAIGQASGAILSRRAFHDARAVGFQIDGISAAYQRILGGVVLTGLCLLWVMWRDHVTKSGVIASKPPSESKWRRVGPWVLINGVTGPALGVSCYQWALKTTPTAIVLAVVALTPLAIIPLSAAVEGERPSARSIAGGVIAVAGVILLSRHR